MKTPGETPRGRTMPPPAPPPAGFERPPNDQRRPKKLLAKLEEFRAASCPAYNSAAGCTQEGCDKFHACGFKGHPYMECRQRLNGGKKKGKSKGKGRGGKKGR